MYTGRLSWKVFPVDLDVPRGIVALIAEYKVAVHAYLAQTEFVYRLQAGETKAHNDSYCQVN